MTDCYQIDITRVGGKKWSIRCYISKRLFGEVSKILQGERYKTLQMTDSADDEWDLNIMRREFARVKKYSMTKWREITKAAIKYKSQMKAEMTEEEARQVYERVCYLIDESLVSMINDIPIKDSNGNEKTLKLTGEDVNEYLKEHEKFFLSAFHAETIMKKLKRLIIKEGYKVVEDDYTKFCNEHSSTEMEREGAKEQEEEEEEPISPSQDDSKDEQNFDFKSYIDLE